MKETIRQAILSMVENKIPITVQWATVDAVDPDNALLTATGLEDGLPFDDVLIGIGSDGVLAIPKVGSKVLIALLENSNTNAAVVMTESLESYRIKLDNGKYLVLAKEGEILINGDGFGGMVKVGELVQRLNRVEKALNQLTSEFNAHTHPSPPAPSNPVVTSAPSVPSSVKVSLTKRNQLENKTVNHG